MRNADTLPKYPGPLTNWLLDKHIKSATELYHRLRGDFMPDMSEDLSLADRKALSTAAGNPNQFSIRGQLEFQKKEMEIRIIKINRALELLDNNPDMEEFTNLTRFLI